MLSNYCTIFQRLVLTFGCLLTDNCVDNHLIQRWTGGVALARMRFSIMTNVVGQIFYQKQRSTANAQQITVKMKAKCINGAVKTGKVNTNNQEEGDDYWRQHEQKRKHFCSLCIAH